MKQTPPIQSVDRALILLGIVGRAGRPISLRELTNVLGIDRSSVYRLAGTLQRHGFLVQLPQSKRYTLGSAIWRMANQAQWPDVLVRVAHDTVVTLAEQTEETSHIAIRQGQLGVIIHHQLTHRPVGVSFPLGRIAPLHCTAIGKSLLCDFKLEDLRSLYDVISLRRMTGNTIASLEELATACKLTRQRGFAVDDQEYHEGVRCIAAPVRDSGGIVAAIGISAPTDRLPSSRRQTVAKVVVRIAGDLSAKLGCEIATGSSKSGHENKGPVE
jgi:DNA-binding IclR family transcriptional regulator